MDGFTGVFGVFLLRDSAMVVLCGAKRTLKGTKNWRCQADSKRIKAFHTASERVVNVQSVTVTYHAIAAHTDSSLLIFSHSPSYSIATFSTIETRKAAFSYIFTQNIPCAPRCSRCSRCVSEFPSVSQSVGPDIIRFYTVQGRYRWILSCGWKIAMHTVRLFGVSLVFASRECLYNMDNSICILRRMLSNQSR